MAKDWEFKLPENCEPGYEEYRAVRGSITMDVWVSLEGDWYANAMFNLPDDADGSELYIELPDGYETRELAQQAIIDRVRAVIETLHADFRGAE